MEDQRDTYRIEAGELLVDMEAALLELEKHPHDPELIDQVFRAMHTIKGSGAMFGFEDIAAFTHEAETVLDMVRAGKIPINKKLINLVLSVGDRVRAMLTSDNPNAGLDAEAQALVESFRKFTGVQAAPVQASVKPEPLATETQNRGTWWIRFKPSPDLFRSGTNPLLLLNELRGLGKAWVLLRTDKTPTLDVLDPESCMLEWNVILTGRTDEYAIKDVFVFVDGPGVLDVTPLHPGLDAGDPDQAAKIDRIFRDHPDPTPDILNAIVQPKREVKPQEPAPSEEKVKSKEFGLSNIRVSAEKLDTMVNLVGELVIAQERLNQYALSQNNPELIPITEELDRLAAELRDSAMAMRMLPIGTLFSKFRRLVRDLASQQGKEIELITEGAETELDKTVIEKIEDPMVHLLRNSVDHGIEPSSVRMFSGKTKKGTIRLSALHSGSDVLIRIADDGSGINIQAVRHKAVEKGLIAADAKLTDEEIMRLIFVPGFSTNQTVTSVSGRGVGMDVVKRNIEALRGSVDVTSSMGKGATMTLKLPLTLGIIRGLLVKISEDHFVLPLSAIHECVELSRSEIDRASGNRWISLRGDLVPYIRLRETFFINGKLPERELVVIIELDGARVGFAVDEVIGEHQIVIEPLGKMYQRVEGLSGATILGDGNVALILDLNRLTAMALSAMKGA